jgi:hypothetical protein
MVSKAAFLNIVEDFQHASDHHF